MSERSRVPAALGALVAMAAVVVGVPVLLIVLVGNPWPGRSRVDMRDEAAVVVGVLTVLAWLVWARFMVAIAVEARGQLAVLHRAAERPDRVELSAPPARGGVGLLAQHLVAAALVLVPVAAKTLPAVAAGPVTLRSERADATMIVMASAPLAAPSTTRATARPGEAVIVVPGDTLFGLARTHLGDPERWREIFELNRDRPQVDGGRLQSPSLLRPGWTLALPAGDATSVAPAAPGHDALPYLAPAMVTVARGDNLWDLSRAQLANAGAPVDDASVVQYLGAVVEANPNAIDDPNLIYVGEEFSFPEIGTPPPAPPPSPPPASSPAAEPPAASRPGPPPEPAAGDPAPPPPASTTPSTTTPAPSPPVDPEPVTAETGGPSSPSPIGLGETALLSAGVLALLAARRRSRLRRAQPRARVPDPPPDTVATERRLRAVDASERLLRVDVAVRAAAATLVDGPARITVVRVGSDGAIDITLTRANPLPAPWEGEADQWRLPGSTPVELIAEAARSVGAPCVALTQLGVDADGRDVLVDLEALGVLSVEAGNGAADAVVRGIAATLATSLFAEVANLIAVDLDEASFLDHRHAHHVEHIDEAVELAATLVGTTATARQSTFVLRSRHTSGEAWEPAIVLATSGATGQLTPEAVRSAAALHGVAMVVAGHVPGAPWSLQAGDGAWTLAPLGLVLTPVGLSSADVTELHNVLERADAALLEEEACTHADSELVAGVFEGPEWALLVRLLGPVDVVDQTQRPVQFERSKTLELVAWLTLHRESSTRAGARTALWELDVRDATFANVVSEARRAMARHVVPPPGEEWLGRTLTEVLPLHDAVRSDVDLVRTRLAHARVQPPELAIETLRPAVELIRDMPFTGTGYLWPDAEGITSNLVLLATSAATELAGHYLSMGDVEGVFWSTGRGLKVLPGHEELIALRMRAHARAGDLAGVRLEWESYERVLTSDPWSDGEPAPKLVMLRRELLS